MPRTARAVRAGDVYHCLNRGNARQAIFHKPADYDAFARVLAEGLGEYPVDLLAWCLMPNHWHLVLRPRAADALARLMGWVGVTHVRRHHAHYRTAGGGHLYQGRFKSFPVQGGKHFLTVCRYVVQLKSGTGPIELRINGPFPLSGPVPLSGPLSSLRFPACPAFQPPAFQLRQEADLGRHLRW